jgi:RNA polymerase sigma-70 factor, ECF subfamily
MPPASSGRSSSSQQLLPGGQQPTTGSESLPRKSRLRRLPAPERVAILMHFHLDLPLAEVAAALGLTVPAIKARINRGLRRLRSALVVSEEARINDA